MRPPAQWAAEAQAREAQEARRPAEAREAWLISMQRTAMDIVMMGVE